MSGGGGGLCQCDGCQVRDQCLTISTNQQTSPFGAFCAAPKVEYLNNRFSKPGTLRQNMTLFFCTET